MRTSTKTAMQQLAQDGRRRFVALIGLGMGALSSLVIGGLWIPPWWLSPCQA